MRIAVGGHSRNIGKTSVVSAIIRATAERRWTAIKITHHEPAAGVVEETDPLGRGDTSRFLAAGAARSYLVHAPEGCLDRVMPALREILASSPDAIFESNRIAEAVPVHLYMVVLDRAVADFKESSRALLPRASAFVVLNADPPSPPWASWIPWGTVPVFEVAAPAFSSPELVEFVRRSAGWEEHR